MYYSSCWSLLLVPKLYGEEKGQEENWGKERDPTVWCALTGTVGIFSLVLTISCEVTIMILKYRKKKLKFRGIKLPAQGHRAGTQILIYMPQKPTSFPLLMLP